MIMPTLQRNIKIKGGNSGKVLDKWIVVVS